jgi:hypothetical protein
MEPATNEAGGFPDPEQCMTKISHELGTLIASQSLAVVFSHSDFAAWRAPSAVLWFSTACLEVSTVGYLPWILSRTYTLNQPRDVVFYATSSFSISDLPISLARA